MTADAVRLCATEDRTGVTGFTIDIDVCAIEYKAGTEMIKCFLRGKRLQRREEH